MARERKSLIDPGLLPDAGDVLSRILANDRAKHRAALLEAEEAPVAEPEAEEESPAPIPEAVPEVTPESETVPLPSPTPTHLSVVEAAPQEPPVRRGRGRPPGAMTLRQGEWAEDPPDAEEAGGELDDLPPRRRRMDPLLAALAEATPPGGEEGHAAARTERLRRALASAAEDEFITVTFRVPTRLKDYMDRYVACLNTLPGGQRYRKQDAMAEAMAAFFADHPLPPARPDNDL